MFNQHFRTNEELGALYSVEDLLLARLSGDDLTSFIHDGGCWDESCSSRDHFERYLPART